MKYQCPRKSREAILKILHGDDDIPIKKKEPEGKLLYISDYTEAKTDGLQRQYNENFKSST